ncbi:stabilizer of axonemal microtubules 4-like [Symsagittifera roscoffensis]|uniref:stabilizer of axonemal microtubules 4-like n=1 Tax=Symsagittifera roscoffensis TaxID=84072 RepID=UPI00307C24E4
MATPLPSVAPPLQWGKPTKHILQSAGADCDLMNRYCTTNSTTFGIQGYRPREGSHHGTGYLTNERAQYQYSRQLDEFDNPVMSRMLADCYDSVTKQSYRPNSVPHGREPLPALMNDNVGTGFTREKAVTVPTVAKAYEPFQRPMDGGLQVLPKFQPHLHKIRPKDPVEQNHYGHGPEYMETEYKTTYDNKYNTPKDLFTKSTGPLTDTGFTSNLNVEPVTFHHDMPYKDLQFNDRPTGSTEYDYRYVDKTIPNGAEPLPHAIPTAGTRENGFTKDVLDPKYKPKYDFMSYTDLQQMQPTTAKKLAKDDPAAFMSVENPNNKTATKPLFYQGKTTEDPSLAKRLNRSTHGPNTDTGFSQNTTILAPEVMLHGPDDKRRFLTHNDLQYYDKNPTGKHREGRVIGAVQAHVEDAYTKSEKVHKLGTGKKWDPSDQLRCQNPMQAKSIKARDTFFDDHLHHPKNRDYEVPKIDKDNSLRPVMNIQKPRLQPYQYDPNFTGAKVGSPRQRHTQHWAVAQYEAA